MHSAARHLANLFTSKAPGEFGQCFKFNRAYYTVYAGNPVTVEEFVEGTFRKYVNTDGKICKQPQGSNADIKTIFEKAECLVHFSYVESSKKLMLLGLQGAKYDLYDPEIATTQWRQDITRFTSAVETYLLQVLMNFMKTTCATNSVGS